MRRRAWIGALLFSAIAGGLVSAGEPPGCEPAGRCFLERVAPAGGWFPYGGGLLHWWNPHCFPCCCGPDDYCRKPQPCVCWPPYPSYYVWGPPLAGPEQLPQPRPESHPGSAPPGRQAGERMQTPGPPPEVTLPAPPDAAAPKEKAPPSGR